MWRERKGECLHGCPCLATSKLPLHLARKGKAKSLLPGICAAITNQSSASMIGMQKLSLGRLDILITVGGRHALVWSSGGEPPHCGHSLAFTTLLFDSSTFLVSISVFTRPLPVSDPLSLYLHPIRVLVQKT